MNIILGLAEFVLPINTEIMGMAPSIVQNGQLLMLPHTTESVVSTCVKIAGSAYMTQELDQYMKDLAYHLSPFSGGSTAGLTNEISRLIYMLSLKFKEYQWYDTDGSCPWRFIGFEGRFDIILGKPDHGSTINHSINLS